MAECRQLSLGQKVETLAHTSVAHICSHVWRQLLNGMTSPLDERVIEGQVLPEPDLQVDKLLCQHRHATFMRMTKVGI